MSCKLLIDGNSLLNTIIGVTLYNKNSEQDLLRPFFKVGEDYQIKSTAADFYNECILKYLYGIIHSIKFIDEVFLCFDSKSWRKVYYEKHCKELNDRSDYSYVSEGYKSDRNNYLDEDKKMQKKHLVKYLANETLFNISQNVSGVTFVSMLGLEGDDLLAYLSNKFKDDKVFIWSNDGDIQQLLNHNNCILGANDKKTMRRKMFNISGDCKVNENVNFFDFTHSSDLYDNFNDIKTNLLQNAYFETKINTTELVFEKVLCGDKSDHIPPCYSDNVAGKKVNVTKAYYYKKIYQELLNSGMSDEEILNAIDNKDEYFIKTVACSISSIMYNSIREDKIELIKKGIIFNITLVRLSLSIIPKELIDFVDTKIINCRRIGQFNEEQFLNYAKIKF